MVTTRRSKSILNEVPPISRDDARGEAESADPEARITQLSQQLAQAQKNVEDLLAQNAVLLAARTPPPNHDVADGTNHEGSGERNGRNENHDGRNENHDGRNENHDGRNENHDGQNENHEERAGRNENRGEPINPVPPTEAERRLQKMVQDLGAKYDMLSKTIDQRRDGKESLVDNLFQHKESIFTEEVSNCDLPGRFKVPDIPVFSGSEDPVEHLDNFRSHVSLHKTPDAVACRAFPLTLSGKARDWLRNLAPRSIDCFDTLGRKFLAQFVSGRARRKPRGYLLSVQQGPNESLKDYLWRFNQEKLNTESAPDDFIYGAIFQGLKKDGPLMAELALKPPKDLQTFMVKMDRYINQEETLRALLSNSQQQQQPSTEKPKKKKNPEPVQDAGPAEYKKEKKNFGDYKWTPLNTSITEVLMELKKDPNYQKPRPIQGNPPPYLAHKYCAFHDSHGHLTEQCVSLRQLIEKFIENGKLVRFLANERNQQERDHYPRPRREEDRDNRRNYQPRQDERRERSREPAPRPRRDERRERSRSRPRGAQQGNIPIIHTISGGFGGGGESNSARKAYARQLDDFEVYSVQRPPKSRKYNPLVIGFSDDDYAGVSLPHTDALVVTLTIANYQTRRILIDTGSSADILFKSAFDHMGVPSEKLVPVSCQLQGFAGEKVLPLGSIDLPVTAGAYPRQKVIMVKFLIVDKVSAYNAIIGRTALNDFRAVTSTPHLSMKFPTEEGVGEVKGDQKEARRCYNLSLKDIPRQHGRGEKTKEDGK